MKKIIIILVLLSLYSCGGSDSSSPPTPPPSSSHSFTIANFTGRTMVEAYLPLSSSPEWGSNQLSTSLTNGSTTQLTNISSGTYDFLGVFTDANSIYAAYRWNINIQNNYSLTLLITDLTGSLKIINNSIYSVTSVYLVPDGSLSWGPNLLSSPIAPGTSYQFVDIDAGNYDLKMILSDGSIYINTLDNLNYTTISHGNLFSVYF